MRAASTNGARRVKPWFVQKVWTFDTLKTRGFNPNAHIIMDSDNRFSWSKDQQNPDSYCFTLKELEDVGDTSVLIYVARGTAGEADWSLFDDLVPAKREEMIIDAVFENVPRAPPSAQQQSVWHMKDTNSCYFGCETRPCRHIP